MLLQFVQWPLSVLEQVEKLEQLRYLENGVKIKMVATSFTGIGIDTPEDLEKAKAFLAKGN
jgi:3-deoxy-manno-octulosonate cytidylyltransferase (CMP-KDO synthetase)